MVLLSLSVFAVYLYTRTIFQSSFSMPKLIDYPRTSYTGAWEVAETVDDTGGKCALETCARKLDRKVSGSFKAIVGSAVKFGLLVSKREVLTTTTLFRRIKHAYDKQEELLFHREAFLAPPLFTQVCRKFRSRELPVAMLDVLLMREFGVEEINAQNVAKAFTDGARMVGILDENNILADIDQLAANQPPRRELASLTPPANVFRQTPLPLIPAEELEEEEEGEEEAHTATASPSATPVSAAPASSGPTTAPEGRSPLPASRPAPAATADAIAHLFNLPETPPAPNRLATPASFPISSSPVNPGPSSTDTLRGATTDRPTTTKATTPAPTLVSENSLAGPSPSEALIFHIQVAGPGLNTHLDIVDVEDLALVRALLNKIERRLNS